MAPVTQNTSSIAMALAGMTASVDIPQPRDTSFWTTGRDTFATVAARSLPANNNKKQSGMLPTPPNSISPSLPPQAFANKPHNTSAATAPPTPPAGPTHVVDSDIDLQEAVDHAKAQDQPQRGGLSLSHNPGNLSGLFDTAGNITPGLLAKHHLPGILLTHGPLAIRHIMGHLTTSVPGFSGIPPAKARRLVVGALEGRGGNSEGAGLHGDVEFEKVGWGRWDAKQRGHHPARSSSRPSQHRTPLHHHSPPPNSTPSSYALRIPHTSNARHSRARPPPRHSRTPSLSHGSEMDFDPPSRSHHLSSSDNDAENEADKMSLDDACSSSECPDEEEAVLDDELGDVTDEEDWASIGAAALRRAQGSLPLQMQQQPQQQQQQQHRQHGGGGRNTHLSARSYSKQDQDWGRGGGAGGAGGGPAKEALAKSMPGFGFQPAFSQLQPLQQQGQGQLWGGFGDMVEDSQEREAIEALVRLSSV